MLSRAARNAYSWWWASHIRTKQSKWLDQNLQDMEEKVEYILKIITEDGDSFRTRAEQYYRKRPELVNFVEDTFRGYRSLAERYDHLSRDLQSANRTIATVFPEKVQMSFDDDDYDEDFTSNFDEDEMKIPTNSNVPLPLPMPPKRNHHPKMENVVQAMIKQKSKMPTKMMSKRGLIKIGVEEKSSRPVSKSSGLSKDEALEEINKLQKDILGFQTEKEFVKSSYENTLSKYWEIENIINEMHAKISDLQHEFGAGAMIEDKDAQTLMSSSALKMCKETLAKMKNNHKRFRKEAIVQHKRADEIRKKFEALIASNKSKSDFEETMEHVKDKKAKIEKKEMNAQMESTESQTMNQKEDEDIKDRESRIKEGILGKDEPITISKVAEKIEQLVDMVINLETDVISQAALIMRLKFENDELLEHLESLENEKMVLVEDSSDMSIKIQRLEEKLEIVQILDHKVKGQNSNLEASFDEVSTSLDSLSNDVLNAKPDENIQEDVTFHDGKEEKTEFSNLENENGFGSYKIHHSEEKAVEENKIKDNDEPEDFVDESTKKDEVNVVESRDINIEGGHHQEFSETTINNYKDVDFISEQGEPNWKLLLSLEIEDREEMLLKEYTSTLKNYKEVKRKLNETEKRNRASSFRSAVQMKMLKKSNESKDSEIRSLYEKLKLLETKMEKRFNFEVKKASNLGNEETEGRTTFDEVKENNKDFEETTNLIDETTQGEDELDDIEYELRKASDAIDEGTHRIKELIENAHSELKKAQGLVEGGTEKRKDQLGETTTNEPTKSPSIVDEETLRTKEIDETQRIEGADIGTYFEVHNKSLNLVDEETQRRRKLGDKIGEAHEVLDIEDEIRTEIDDFRKENLELWLRFSTSYHQINRFQDSYNDLLQEIKDVKETKHAHDQKHHQHHQQNQHSHYVSSDVRPLYRQLRDMHTEVILWLEKSGILEDDLQHRLTSFSDIQNEISGISTSEYSNAEKTTTTPLGEHQAAKFQGEVLNMKQENANVLDELRVASERVRKLQVDLERTLSELDAELGKIKKSDSSLKVPFKSFLFGAKLRRKSRSSLFKCMSPSLRRHRSSDIKQPSPQPKEDNV